MGMESKVSSDIPTDMGDLIRMRSMKIMDPAAREVEVLKDSEAIALADEYCCGVHEVYIVALTVGIYPYRYVRNREIISTEEQLRLAQSRVVVVGAGGLGGHVILLLARLGVGHLVVVDNDVFDETNLNRQALCSERALGRSKSEQAVKEVGSINPGVKVVPYGVKLEPHNATEILAGSNVVVDALDNVPDRLALEGATKKLGIPMVHGALAGFEGQLMTIFPEDPGLEHLYRDWRTDLDKSKSPEAVLGVPIPTPSIISTLQAMEVIKIILNRGRLFRNTMLYIDLETGQLNEFVIQKGTGQ
jgi:molybdopterin/thiamine biosynthesis adenylyltransferase